MQKGQGKGRGCQVVCETYR